MLQFMLTAESLCTCLADLPPVALKGLALLQTTAPLQRDCVREATLELIAYTDACLKTLHRLRNIPPIPLLCPTLEWVL